MLTPDAAGESEGETYQLEVTGMTCGSCQARVQRVLSREPGVRDAVVNLAREQAAAVYFGSFLGCSFSAAELMQ